MDEVRPDSSGVSFPPPFVYGLGLLAGYLLHRAVPIALVPAGMLRALGWVLVALGALLAAWALAYFARAGQTPDPRRPVKAIVAHGPYRFTRNPMYLAMAVVYLGVTALMNDFWPLIVFPVVLVIMIRAVIAREEAYLERAFGDEYRAYRTRVRRWI
jgi:protein-S-isoprenylcysteine O-methyltransferase Ste14